MKRKYIFIFLLIVLISPIKSFSQKYLIINENVKIKIELSNDSIQVILDNVSDKSIFIPVENYLIQEWSNNNDKLYLEFGIDLVVFNERGIHQLDEIKSGEQKSFKAKLINYRNNLGLNFSYQFYMRKLKKKYQSKTFYNTDFTKNKNWAKKGNWESFELLIEK